MAQKSEKKKISFVSGIFLGFEKILYQVKIVYNGGVYLSSHLHTPHSGIPIDSTCHLILVT